MSDEKNKTSGQNPSTSGSCATSHRRGSVGAKQPGADTPAQASATDPARDQRLLDRCATLGLPLLKAIQFAVASNPHDPYALLRVLDLDFSTYAPMQHRRPKRWLWMAAQTSSVSYLGTLTETGLLEILTGGNVPDEFRAHMGHFFDEAPITFVVMAVAEAAQRSSTPIQTIWRNVAKIAPEHSDSRYALWSDVQA